MIHPYLICAYITLCMHVIVFDQILKSWEMNGESVHDWCFHFKCKRNSKPCRAGKHCCQIYLVDFTLVFALSTNSWILTWSNDFEGSIAFYIIAISLRILAINICQRVWSWWEVYFSASNPKKTIKWKYESFFWVSHIL